MHEKLITPSILNVNKNDREEIIKKLIDKGFKWFHYDVMDGIFVPNKAIGIDEIIKFKTNLPKHLSDAHLMVENPFNYAKKIRDFVTCITVHYESFSSENELIDFVNEFAITNWIGLAIKPSTSINQIRHLIYLFDLILIMSVEPGKGGQTFIESTYAKIQQLNEFINEEKLNTIIQVDGGIKDFNSKKIFKSGSTLNVVGTYLIENIDKKDLKDKLI